mgnify:CR=1 FL=1|tara:strand:- start:224 stop:472 length:249 start_codon:yes stop_codon:yes gene_type:complete
MEKITGTLNVIKKLPLSRMGNPKYRIEINGIQFETRTNASLGYSVTNFDNKKVIATVTNTGYAWPILEDVENLYQSKNIRGV